MQGDSQLVGISQGEEASRSGTPRLSAIGGAGDQTGNLPVASQPYLVSSHDPKMPIQLTECPKYIYIQGI